MGLALRKTRRRVRRSSGSSPGTQVVVDRDMVFAAGVTAGIDVACRVPLIRAEGDGGRLLGIPVFTRILSPRRTCDAPEPETNDCSRAQIFILVAGIKRTVA